MNIRNTKIFHLLNTDWIRLGFVFILIAVTIESIHAADRAEIDGIRYEYIEYEQGLRLVRIIGVNSSKIPENLVIPTKVKDKNFMYGGTCVPVEIYTGAFSSCTNLKSINSTSIRKIKANAFAGCISLQRVSFGSSCRSIASKAFTGCTAIDTVHYISGATVAEDAFDEYTYQNAKLIVPDEKRDECNNHEVWSKFQNKIYRYTISLSPTYGNVSYNGEIVNSGDFKTFSALEGSSITLSFTPDTGRELANLIINGEDVTSKVINNQYTIDNVSESLDIQVSFYSITITTKGNGQINCKKKYNFSPLDIEDEYGNVRNNTSTFIVPISYSLRLYVYPDNGFYLAKIIKDGVDITSQTSTYNNPLSIDIPYSTKLEFTFEEIPPVTYKLSVKATGNGTVSYNGTNVREGENTFEIEEGNSPIVSFTPDTGNKIKSVKLNNKDITSELANNQYTINNVSSDNNLEVEFEPITHSLTIKTTGYGSATFNGTEIRDNSNSFTVNEGTAATIAFTPDADYRIKTVKLNSTNITSSIVNGQYTISNISSDNTLEVEFEKAIYMLNIKSTGNGTTLYNSTSIRNQGNSFTVDEGTTAVITFSPDAGYRIKSVIINGADVTAFVTNSHYTVSNISANTTIEVEYDAIPIVSYSLSISATGNGTITYNGTIIRGKSQAFNVDEGASATVTFTPDDGYKISSVKVNDVDVTSNIANNLYTISNLSANTTLKVVFEPITHSLSITASGNGSASYNNTAVRGKTQTFTVNEGNPVIVSFTPDAGYRIASVKVNNSDVTANVVNSQYTISNIAANTTLSVTFEAITHSLSITASGNGSAGFNSTSIRNKTEVFTVNEGISAVVKFTPDAGYKIKCVKLNGTDITSSVSDSQYTISNISSDTTFEVAFETITHTLSITASGNGSATYNSTAVRGKTQTFTVNEGTSATITFTPDAGYRIASVKVNNTDVTANVVSNKYTISNITANTTLSVTFEAITHTLSITASGNGSVTYNSTAVRGKTQTFNINEGTSAVVKFTPDTGYKLKSVKLNGTDVTASVSDSQYTISNISSDTTLEVAFEAITHTLSITASGNGSATYNSTAVRGKTQVFTVNEGTSATITFAPDAGHRIASVKVNNTDVTANVVSNKYTISNITANTTLSVTFEAITHTLSITASGNGSVTYNSTAVRGKTQTFNINEGTSAVVKFSPDTGYKLKSVKLNGTDVTSSVSNNQYTISNISSDTNLEVVFEGITHTLSITASGNGSATYSSTTVRGKTQAFIVNEGTSATITFTPDAGYRIASIKVNNTDVTANVVSNKYTISNITANTTLSVTFEAITHTLSITASGNGSATYNSTTVRDKTQAFTVNEGSSATITFAPDAGYRIASMKVNNTDVTADVVSNKYTISNITANTTLSVTFEAITHTLSITASGNGSVTYNSTAVRGKTQTFSINEGTSAVVKFSPDTGYKLKSVKLNGTDVTASVSNSQYTISNINSDTTLEVEFEAITHTLTITTTGNGSVTYNSTAVRGKTQTFTVNEGSSARISFAPDAGYRIANVKVNNKDVTGNVVNNQYTISNITANTTLSVTFEVIPPTTFGLTITTSGNGSANYNGTTIRGKSSSFTVNEGTSATITFVPDAGYKIASVKVNNADVTANVVSNKYTISNITANTTLSVTFEAITHTLSITASGNGSATYNSTTVRDKTQAFTVNEGSSATISFAPDEDFRIASVKLNDTDVTASIANNQYTITNITADTKVEVTFEAIPNYTLTIQSTAFGSVKYGDAVITNRTETFTVREGESALLTFMPDGNGRMISIRLNGTDITQQLSNGQYTINNITADTKVEAEFAEDITKLMEGSVAYNVTSYDEGSVVVAPGNYGQVLTVPATLEAKGKTWTVTGIADDALAGNSTLAAVIWEPEVAFTATVTNPNLLLYVKRAEYAPEAIQNVVVGDMAESIVLTDAAEGNDFYCPRAFTARRITYEHNYGMTTGYHETQGWETIVLPFEVTTVLNRRGTELVAYATWQHGSNQRPYWLYRLAEQGWQPADGIKANTPYIISMPNNPVYEPSYCQTGYIQFVGSNVTVAASDQTVTSRNGSKQLVASYQTQAASSSIYALNATNLWSTNTDTAKEGSTFIRGLRTVHPFEAYLTLEGSNAPRAISIFADETTKINEELRMKNEEIATAAGWYDLQGRRLNGEPKHKGVYIHKGKKVKR